jgi:hypothetical protein
MTEKQKSIFELIFKYLNSRNCETAEFDLDAYSYSPYNGRSYSCVSGDNLSSRSDDKLPFDVSDFITEFINSESLDIDDDNLVELQLMIHPKTRKIELIAVYSDIVDGTSEQTEREASEDETTKALIDSLENSGLYPYAEIQFDGSGDSGYIHDHISVDSGLKPSKDLTNFPQLQDYLYDMLNNYGGWEINEGSYGVFTISLSMGTVTLDFTWNEYQNETVPIKTWKM